MSHENTHYRELPAVTPLGQRVCRRVDSLSGLPTAIAVAMKVMELGKHADAGPAEYARVIGSCPCLSAKLLGLANSSWSGVRNPVTRPLVAINLIGLATVRTLAISSCLAGLHSDLRLSGEESNLFWIASLRKAVAARQFTAATHDDNTEEAFAAGLFQDFGLCVMFAAAREQMMPIIQNLNFDHARHLEAERRVFGFDHTQIGRIIARKLGLPELFVNTIAHHHNHAALRPTIANPVLADATFAAGLLPHALDEWNGGDVDALGQFLTRHATGALRDSTAFLTAAQNAFDDLYRYFDNGRPPQTTLPELIEAATRNIVDGVTQMAHQSGQLQQEMADIQKERDQLRSRQDCLEELARHDSLTGALNRNGLIVHAVQRLQHSNRQGIAVAFIDMDNFKKLNDSFGHRHGDAVLRHLVSIVRQTIRPTDVIARVGGDEFVIFLDHCTETDAVAILRRILERLTTHGVACDNQTARPAFSVGLLLVPPDVPVQSFDVLMAAADQLMYQSKRAGGNRIRAARLPAGIQAA